MIDRLADGGRALGAADRGGVPAGGDGAGGGAVGRARAVPPRARAHAARAQPRHLAALPRPLHPGDSLAVLSSPELTITCNQITNTFISILRGRPRRRWRDDLDTFMQD